MFSLDTLLGSLVFQPTVLNGPLRRFPDDAESSDEVYWPMWHALTLPCLRIQPKGAAHRALLLHGNADTLSGCRPLAHILAEMLEADVYVLEYPGYWLTATGVKATPSAEGVYDAALRASRFLLQKCGQPLCVMGYSLGCSPAARVLRELDTKVELGVLVAPMRSLVELAADLDPRAAAMKWLIGRMDTFQTEKDASHISARMMVVHGASDEIIPVEHGRRCGPAAPRALPTPRHRLVGRH